MRARKEERNQAIWKAYKEGKMQKDIAKEFGLSRGRVCKIFNEQDRRNAFLRGREGDRNEAN